MSEITYLHLLTAKTMLSNSSVWLNNPEIVQMVENHPMGPGVLGEVRGAHDELNRALSWRMRLGAELLAMTRRITAQDHEHDRMLRMLYYILTGLAEGADDPAEAERYLAARNLLIPDGLAQTRMSYAEEHGAAVAVQLRITPEIEQLLQQTVVAGRSLLEVYQRWLAAGQLLGELVKERSRVESSMLMSAEGPIHVREARRIWLRVVRMFITAVDVMDLPGDGWRRIFSPLQRDVATALEALRARMGEVPDELGDELPGDIDDELPGDIGDELPGDIGDELPSEISA